MMKKIISTFLSAVIATTMFAGCSLINNTKSNGKSDIELSENYLIGTYSYGQGEGGIQSVEAYLIITTDKTVEVYFPKDDENFSSPKEDKFVLADTLDLTKKQYKAIEEAVDADELMDMKVKSNKDTEDGGYDYLYLYDEDDEIAKEIGGYEPKTKEFKEVYSVIQDNVPQDEIDELKDEWLAEFGSNNDVVETIDETEPEVTTEEIIETSETEVEITDPWNIVTESPLEGVYSDGELGYLTIYSTTDGLFCDIMIYRLTSACRGSVVPISDDEAVIYFEDLEYLFSVTDDNQYSLFCSYSDFDYITEFEYTYYTKYEPIDNADSRAMLLDAIYDWRDEATDGLDDLDMELGPVYFGYNDGYLDIVSSYVYHETDDVIYFCTSMFVDDDGVHMWIKRFGYEDGSTYFMTNSDVSFFVVATGYPLELHESDTFMSNFG